MSGLRARKPLLIFALVTYRSFDMDEAIEYRSKFQHFRTLIIGRANAGKTTLLKKVCNSIEDPEIFSPSGEKVIESVAFEHRQSSHSRSIAARSIRRAGVSRGLFGYPAPIHPRLIVAQRGIHDIENELIFRSNPQFIFHDSRGFESGSLDEIKTVKSFIADRARSRELPEQLHAIWYGDYDSMHEENLPGR